MKNYCFFVLCAIFLFAIIIEAKPYCSSCSDYDDDGQESGGGDYGGGNGGQGGGNGGQGGGNGGQRGGNGGQGGGNGGQRGGNGGQGGGGGRRGGGNGGRGGGGSRGGDDYDFSNIYKYPCRGRGCKNNYVGNGHDNTNTVYMYD